MTVWVRGFVIPEVVDVHLLFGRLITKAALVEATYRGTPLAAPAAATLRELRRAYVDFNDGLRPIAEVAAKQATIDIRARLAATQVRPDTRTSPHLRDLIYCAALSVGLKQTGMVGIGRVSTLERAVNRNTPGYGSYWRAQEFGTGGGEVPSQIGRILFGYFVTAGGGDRVPPRSEYGGGGGGPHPIFLSAARGGRGSAQSVIGYMKRIDAMPSRMVRALDAGGKDGPGFGTIGHEIRPRRFIGIGADAAAVRWREQIAALQQRTLDEITAITVP